MVAGQYEARSVEIERVVGIVVPQSSEAGNGSHEQFKQHD